MRRSWWLFPVGAIVAVLAGCSSPDDSTTTSTPESAPDSPPASDSESESIGAVGTLAASDAISEGITVVGRGLVTGRPDVLRATIGVEVTADDVQSALTTANERADAVIQALRDEGLDDSDIQTQDISLRQSDRRPPPEPGVEPPPGDVEVVAVNVVEVRISDLERAGEILQAAAEAGGDTARIRGVRFELEDDEELLSVARERAFADAREKAEHYAELAGRELGDLVVIREHDTGQPPSPFPMADAAVEEAEAVPIEPGQQELSVRVTAVWSMR